MNLASLKFLSLSTIALLAGCAATPSEETASAGQDMDLASATSPNGYTSAYTENTHATPLDTCKVTRNDYIQAAECGEMAGYTMTIAKDVSDPSIPVGEGLSMRTPLFDLEVPFEALPAVGNVPARPGIKTGSGYFAKLAEWRGKGTKSATAADPYSGRVEPVALIQRYFTATADAPYGSFKGQNQLLIFKLTPEAVCPRALGVMFVR